MESSFEILNQSQLDFERFWEMAIPFLKKNEVVNALPVAIIQEFDFSPLPKTFEFGIVMSKGEVRGLALVTHPRPVLIECTDVAVVPALVELVSDFRPVSGVLSHDEFAPEFAKQFGLESRRSVIKETAQAIHCLTEVSDVHILSEMRPAREGEKDLLIQW